MKVNLLEGKTVLSLGCVRIQRSLQQWKLRLKWSCSDKM